MAEHRSPKTDNSSAVPDKALLYGGFLSFFGLVLLSMADDTLGKLILPGLSDNAWDQALPFFEAQPRYAALGTLGALFFGLGALLSFGSLFRMRTAIFVTKPGRWLLFGGGVFLLVGGLNISSAATDLTGHYDRAVSQNWYNWPDKNEGLAATEQVESSLKLGFAGLAIGFSLAWTAAYLCVGKSFLGETWPGRAVLAGSTLAALIFSIFLAAALVYSGLKHGIVARSMSGVTECPTYLRNVFPKAAEALSLSALHCILFGLGLAITGLRLPRLLEGFETDQSHARRSIARRRLGLSAAVLTSAFGLGGACGLLSPSPTRQLILNLSDEESEATQKAALERLVAQGPSVIPDLVEALREPPGPGFRCDVLGFRRRIYEVIAAIHHKNDASTILRQYANDRSKIIRLRLGLILASRREYVEALGPLMPLLKPWDGTYATREAATQQFIELGNRARPLAPMAIEILLILCPLNSGDELLEALQWLEPSVAPMVFARLRECPPMRSRNPFVFYLAFKTEFTPQVRQDLEVYTKAVERLAAESMGNDGGLPDALEESRRELNRTRRD